MELNIETEPEKWKQFLALTHIGSGKKSLLGTTWVKANKKGIFIGDGTLLSIVVLGAFSKKYFLDYKCTKESEVPIGVNMVNPFDYGFKDDKKVNIKISDEDWEIKGKTEKYKNKLLNFDKIDIIATKPSEVGLLTPKLLSRDLISFKTNSSNLLITTGGEWTSVKIVFEEEGTPKVSLTLKMPGMEDFVRNVVITEHKGTKELELKFNSEFLYKFASMLDGEIWVTLFQEEGEDGEIVDGIILSKKDKDYMISYVLAPVEDEEEE